MRERNNLEILPLSISLRTGQSWLVLPRVVSQQLRSIVGACRMDSVLQNEWITKNRSDVPEAQYQIPFGTYIKSKISKVPYICLYMPVDTNRSVVYAIRSSLVEGWTWYTISRRDHLQPKNFGRFARLTFKAKQELRVSSITTPRSLLHCILCVFCLGLPMPPKPHVLFCRPTYCGCLRPERGGILPHQTCWRPTRSALFFRKVCLVEQMRLVRGGILPNEICWIYPFCFAKLICWGDKSFIISQFYAKFTVTASNSKLKYIVQRPL